MSQECGTAAARLEEAPPEPTIHTGLIDYHWSVTRPQEYTVLTVYHRNMGNIHPGALPPGTVILEDISQVQLQRTLATKAVSVELGDVNTRFWRLPRPFLHHRHSCC